VIHHDAREYNVAVGQTVKKFQAQLEETIHKSKQSAMSVIDKVSSEMPRDRIVHSQAMRFAIDADTILMGTKDRKAKGHFQEGLHKHALNQVCDRAGVPQTFLNRLLERPYGRELLIENLSTIYEKEENQKFLVRSVNDQVRGVLSDSFRRMDSVPVIEAFAKTCGEIGAVPVEGIGGDLRWAVKAILPMVFQPSKKAGTEEVVAFYAQLANSDFGKGALSLRIGMLRIVCTNYATLDEALRQVHLGKRLDENIEFSQETYNYDTKTMVSMVKDIVKGALGPGKINETVGLIGKALEERIDPKQAWQELPKLGLLKGEVDKVQEIFMNGGVEELPIGTTRARLANAISWFAKSAETPERRMELEIAAGDYMVEGKKRRKEAAAA
jgi:hypothetical protein